jgi:alanine racemase
VREASRLAGGRPILAVIKNNAYGLGDQVIGPIIAGCDEVYGLACVRAAEAVAMREAGVTKPILNMAEVVEEEGLELARQNVHQAVWLDDAPARLESIASRTGRPVPVHLYLDCGMNREGMPDYRAAAWVETLCRQKSVQVDGTFVMFPHVLDSDRAVLDRFLRFTEDAKARGLALGKLHAAPSYEVLYFPDAHLDMVRPGNLLFGNFSREAWLREEPNLRTVFRLCARVVRLERLRAGDSASFGRSYIATKPTWLALLPVGHTDGYPAEAANRCPVLIRGRLYPVVGVVSSTHTLVEIGDEKTVEVGDTATLIGPDDPAISPHAIANATNVGFYRLITKMSALLPKRVV